MHPVELSFQGSSTQIPSPLQCHTYANGTPQRIVLACHGFGDNAQNFATLGPAMAVPNTLWIFAQGPQPAPMVPGGWQWYSLFEPPQPQLSQSIQNLKDLAALCLESTGCPPENFFFLGFSQGALIAQLAAFHTVGPQWPRLGGVVALSGYVAQLHRLNPEQLTYARQLPLFVAHGNQDQVVLPAWHYESVDTLMALGFGFITRRIYPMGHEIHPQEAQEVAQFIEGTL